ncbi:MAG: hypothetical protein IKY55_06820 [Phascolarctobacterium sp.]|nr:hypothetical protein [Phascolarctobacterium sp.]MBR4959100.1 hypothetical protein [Phascolarctobacterium sp.]MBR5589479.1 hypothetical protein [Phascolarctobacterium sp.]
MNTSMIVYRLFDVADEINLDLVQALWTSRNKIASRLRLDRISTKSITFKNPPVLVELGNHDLEINGKTYFTEVKARIFDIGVISLILRIEFEEDVTEAEYMDMAIASENMPEDKIREYLDSVLETIEQACTRKRVSDFEEDFVVYYFKDEMPKWDIVPLLLKDKTPVSEQTRQNTLANYFSYSDDITYLAWDSALVYDKTGSLDVPDLLEFANAQFLELRYYDNALADAIDRSYDELEEANVANKANRVEAYRRIRSRLMEIMADISNIMGNINNALQVTEDIFYARIYTRYLELLKATVWKDNIDYKLNTIQRTYTLMNEEVESYRLERMSMTSAIILAGILLVSIVGLFLK